MNPELLWLILTMGIGVLFTYVHLFDSSNTTSLVRPLPLKIWIPSMLMTVTAFIYMSIDWIWHKDADSTVFGMFALFFVGALLWAPMSADAVHRREKTSSVFLALWLAAAGSIGLFVVSFRYVDDPWLIVASSWFMVHHVLVDAIFWWMRWHLYTEDRALFTLDEEVGQRAVYDNMEFI